MDDCGRGKERGVQQGESGGMFVEALEGARELEEEEKRKDE